MRVFGERMFAPRFINSRLVSATHGRRTPDDNFKYFVSVSSDITKQINKAMEKWYEHAPYMLYHLCTFKDFIKWLSWALFLKQLHIHIDYCFANAISERSLIDRDTEDGLDPSPYIGP